VHEPHAILFENIHPRAAERLEGRGCTVETETFAPTPEALVERLRSVPGEGPLVIGIRSKTKVTAEVFERVPRLAAIGAFCIGTDQIDLDEARSHGVAVFNAPFSSTRSVAELVIGEIIALARGLFEKSTAAHAGRWAKSAKGAHEVRGKSLGIVGYGHIGSQVSILAEALGMKVRYYDIVAKLPLGNAVAVSSLDELLAASDFVTLHVPDTPRTRGMIGREALDRMRPGAYLINASRGTVVDLEALAEALDQGRLAGAAIDVFPVEPKRPDEPFDSVLRGRANVLLTPHIGGSTQEAQANIGEEVAAALASFFERGSTGGGVVLPSLDEPLAEGVERIWNVHRNVPGVLSAIVGLVAQAGVNIVGQHLATRDDVGLVFVDVPAAERLEVERLAAQIEALDTSIRTRIVRGRV